MQTRIKQLQTIKAALEAFRTTLLMASPPKPVRHHKWKIPAYARQNVTFHDNDNIRIFTREHERGWYAAPYYRVDMFQPALGVNGGWIPLMTPDRKEVLVLRQL